MIRTEEGDAMPSVSAQPAAKPLTVIRSIEEVADMFNSLSVAPKIETTQSGGAVKLSYGGQSVEIKRGAAVPARRGTSRLR